MSEYKLVKISKLKLKGQGSDSKKKKLKKKRKHDDQQQDSEDVSKITSSDAKFKGWWNLKTFEHLNCGIVALQTAVKNSFIYAVDNGTLRLGNEHDVEEDYGTPVDEEMFTLIQIAENKIALKSGYGELNC